MERLVYSIEEEQYDMGTMDYDAEPDVTVDEFGYRCYLKSLAYNWTRDEIATWIKRQPYVVQKTGQYRNGRETSRRVYWIGLNMIAFNAMLTRVKLSWSAEEERAVAIEGDVFELPRDEFTNKMYFTPRDLSLFLRKSRNHSGFVDDGWILDFPYLHWWRTSRDIFAVGNRDLLGLPLNANVQLTRNTILRGTVRRLLRAWLFVRYRNNGLDFS